MRICHHESAIIDYTGQRIYNDRMKNDQARTDTFVPFLCSKSVASVAGTSIHFSSSEMFFFQDNRILSVGIGERNTSTFFFKIAGIAKIQIGKKMILIFQEGKVRHLNKNKLFICDVMKDFHNSRVISL